MTDTAIKNFTIIICSIYSYRKLLNLKRYSLPQVILNFFFSLILSFTGYTIRLFDPLLSIMIMIVLLFTFITLITKTTLELSITTTILSLGISYTAFALAVLIAGTTIYTLSFIFKLDPKTVPSMATNIAIACIQYLLILLPFRLKRLRKGMPFLHKIGSTNAGVLISTILLCSVILLSTRQLAPLTFVVLYLSSLLCSVFVFLWWRNRIKQSYLDRIQRLEIETLQHTVWEKDNEIEKLRKENEALSKIIHRDNKLIPAMTLAVSDFLQCCQDKDKQEILTKGEELLSYLRSSSEDRLGIINNYQTVSKTLISTKVYSIDSLLKYMLNKSNCNHINFDLMLTGSAKYMIENVISEADLNTLLSDLLENAIIATKYSHEKRILVHLGIIDNHYVIEVLDSGIPFEEEILENFGIKQVTTHSEEGGSGIGLITIYELVKQYQASFILEECNIKNTGFTKKISIIFDQAGEFIINLPYFEKTRTKSSQDTRFVQDKELIYF